jgi:hypothetical protein
MGMSASQARFLSLTARKTNVEYEGQQINQQRTTLSNESSNYYSQLTSMAVPVPPSTQDFTKITYTFNDGSAKNTVTSLVATRNTAKSGLYMLNYVQEIPSHNMVVNGTSIVTKTNDKYNIGTVELQEAGNDDYSIEKFTKAGIPYQVVVAMSEKERQQKLAVEQQYVAMASEKYANDDWLVRYQRNSSTGSYEAVLYSLKELQNTDYNIRTGTSLSGIRQYVFGETTESREIKNVQAKLTQDSTGRYQTITIYNDDEIATSVIQGDTRTPAQINSAEDWQAREPKLSDYVDSYTSPVLYENYSRAISSCHQNAINGNGTCYKHVLAHLLDLSLNSDGSVNKYAYPKSFKSTIANGFPDTTVGYDDVFNTKIYRENLTGNLGEVSDAIKNGYKPEGKDKYYTVTTTSHTASDTEFDRLIGDYYISQNNATDTQKLLSNYYVNSNGQVVNKTLEQKCIDLVKALDLYNKGNLEISDYGILTSILMTIDDDVQMFTLNDEAGYRAAYANWQNSKPQYNEPVIGDITTYSVQGSGTTYVLTTTTETDDIAYNNAMNQYYYDKAQYDQMVQNVNAKIEIIQTQDKNLELKLKQLDTEQNAIQTEMDAVKKVISKNVESSFKTFNA